MTTASNVTVSKPANTGGAVHACKLPLGSGVALPTDTSTTVPTAFADMGYISDDGVKNAEERETESIKAWGGDEVAKPQTGKSDVFTMKFIEALNTDVLKVSHGEGNVTGNLTSGMTVKHNADELDHYAWVIDMIMTGGVKHRKVIPDGQVTEIGEVVYVDGEAVGYEATITAYKFVDRKSVV